MRIRNLILVLGIFLPFAVSAQSEISTPIEVQGDSQPLYYAWADTQNSPNSLGQFILGATFRITNSGYESLYDYGPGTLTIDTVERRNWNAVIRQSHSSVTPDNNVPLYFTGTLKLDQIPVRIGEGLSTDLVVHGSIFAVNGRPTLQMFYGSSLPTYYEAIRILRFPIEPSANIVSGIIEIPSNQEVTSPDCGDTTPSTAPATSFNITSECDNPNVDQSNCDGSSGPATFPLRSASIAIDSDYAWYKLYGSTSNQVAATYLYSVSKNYERAFRVAFRFAKFHTWASPDPYIAKNDATSLLNRFTANVEFSRYLGDANIYHFISGRNPLPTMIGVPDLAAGFAGIGTLCKKSWYLNGLVPGRAAGAFGISLLSNNPEYFHKVITHELGHNFGARHVPFSIYDPTTVMTPGRSVKTFPPRFHNWTHIAIDTHLAQDGSCLQSGYGYDEVTSVVPASTEFIEAPADSSTPGAIAPIANPPLVIAPVVNTPQGLTLQADFVNGGLSLTTQGISGVANRCTLRIEASPASSFKRRASKSFRLQSGAIGHSAFSKNVGNQARLARGETTNTYYRAGIVCPRQKVRYSNVATLGIVPSTNRRVATVSGYLSKALRGLK